MHQTLPRQNSGHGLGYTTSTILKRPVQNQHFDSSFYPRYDTRAYDGLDAKLDPLLSTSNSTLSKSPRRIRPIQKMNVHTVGVDSGITTDDMSKVIFDLQLRLKQLKDTIGYDPNEEAIYERIDDRQRFKKKETQKSFSKRQKIDIRIGNSGFYKLKYLLDPGVSVLSKFIWIFLILLCLGLFTYQLTEHLFRFFNSPTYTNIEHRKLNSIAFPLVTLCNLNPFRLSPVSKLGMYETLHQLQHQHKPLTNVKSSQDFNRLGMSYQEFLKNISHQKETFINSCYWQDGKCSVHSFTRVFMDDRICYTFKPQLNRVLQEGSSGGLYLILNVEQYEYIINPRSSVGVRIFVHDTAGDFAESGMELPVGKHSSVEIKRERIIDSSSHEKLCTGFSYLWKKECNKKCERRFDCKCSEGSRLPVAASRQTREDDLCECPNDCERRGYKLFVTHAGMPTYGVINVKRSLNEKKVLKSEISVARDLYHRMDPSIYKHDRLVLKSLTKNLKAGDLNTSSFLAELYAHESNNMKHSDDLRISITKLHVNLDQNHKSFEHNGHVAFLYLLTTVRSNINAIEKKANILADDHASDVIKNQTMKEIIMIITQIVKTPEKWYTREPALSDIIRGLNRFRGEVIEGYSNTYKEFRKNKRFYEEKVNKTLVLITFLSKELSEGYRLLKNASSILKLNKRTAEVYMHSFYTKKIANAKRYFDELSHELGEFSGRYRLHKEKVLDLGQNLSQLVQKMTNSFSDIKSNIKSITELLKSLHKTIQHLSTLVVMLAKDYEKRQFGKSEFLEQLKTKNIQNSLQKSVKLTRQVSTFGLQIQDTGQEMKSELQSISGRLLDFNLTSRTALHQQIQWLDFHKLSGRLQALGSNIEHIDSTFSAYQAEINDFIKGNRIDEEFYRNNFLQVQIYFGQLMETVIEQKLAYSLFDFICDVGGALALYLGISILTAFEFIDFLLYLLRLPFVKNS